LCFSAFVFLPERRVVLSHGFNKQSQHCRKVPKAGDPYFKKEMLPQLWEQKGVDFLADTTPKHKRKMLDSFKLPPEVRSRFHDEFCIVDADESGALDAQELSDLFGRLALQVSDQVCKAEGQAQHHLLSR
jgi:hypothetical protein